MIDIEDITLRTGEIVGIRWRKVDIKGEELLNAIENVNKPLPNKRSRKCNKCDFLANDKSCSLNECVFN